MYITYLYWITYKIHHRNKYSGSCTLQLDKPFYNNFTHIANGTPALYVAYTYKMDKTKCIHYRGNLLHHEFNIKKSSRFVLIFNPSQIFNHLMNVYTIQYLPCRIACSYNTPCKHNTKIYQKLIIK